MSLSTDTINKFRTNKQLHNDIKGDFDQNEVNVLNLVGKNQLEENVENVTKIRRGKKRKRQTLRNPYTYKEMFAFYSFCGFISDDMTESQFMTKCSKLLECMSQKKYKNDNNWLNENAFPSKNVSNASPSPTNNSEAIFQDFSKNKQITDEMKKTLVQKDIMLENSIKESELLKSRLESSESEHRLRMDEKIAIISFLDREQKQINHRLGQAKKTENRLRSELDTRREEVQSLQIQAVNHHSQLKSLQEEKETMAAQLSIMQDQLSQYIIRANVLEETNKSLEEELRAVKSTQKIDEHYIRNVYKSASVNDLDETLQEIRALEGILNEKAEETKAWKKEYTIKEEQVEQMISTLDQTIARRAQLENEKGDFHRRYDEVTKENEELQAQIEEMNVNKDSENLNLHSKKDDLQRKQNDLMVVNDVLKKRFKSAKSS